MRGKRYKVAIATFSSSFFLGEKNMQQDELYHFGILGMKWGVRRYQNKDGTLTSAGKKHYDNLVRKKAPIVSKDNIVTGRDAVLKKGTELLRVTTQSESVDDRIKYATLKDETDDYGNYADSAMWMYNRGDANKTPLLETYETKKDLKIATGEQVINDLLAKYGDRPASEYNTNKSLIPFGKKETDILRSDLGRMKMKDLFSEMGDLNDIARAGKYPHNYSDDADQLMLARAEAGNEFITTFMQRHFDYNSDVLDKYRKAGYDAVADVMDIGQGFARQPIIILDPKQSMKKTSSKHIDQYDEYNNPKGDKR